MLIINGMATKNSRKNSNRFEQFSNWATRATGSSYAFIIACLIIMVWLISGPVFQYSDTWQLVINTGTTIITFLMVFLIQKSQNKDSKAIQIKLNELIAANDKASNRMVSIEDLTEKELDQLHKFYAHLAHLAKKENNIFESHSVGTAEVIHRKKKIKQHDITNTDSQNN